MGLKQQLITQNSNLRLLKFGKDLPGAGTSKQPYVTKPLPGVEDPLSPNSPDYLLRQGTLRRIVDDETRFFKYFTSTPGLAFIGKQNLLSLTSVRTQASKGPSNQGVYLPTSTAAQLAANPFGGHLNFLGADPTGLIPGISITKYEDLTKPSIDLGLNSSGLLGRVSNAVSDTAATIGDALGIDIGGDIVNNNRLVNLSKDLGLIGEKPDETPLQTGLGGALQTARNFLSKGKTILYSYNGGPGAAEGIGKTNIYRYSNTGFDNPLYTNNPNYFLGKNNGKIHTPDDPSTWETIPLGATDYYNGTGLYNLGQSGIATPSSFLGSTFFLNNINTSVYKLTSNNPLDPTSPLTTDTQVTEQNNTQTYTQDQLIQQEKYSNIGEIREDFRKNLRNQTQSPSYSGDKKLDIRTNQGNPGIKGNITSYENGKLDNEGNLIDKNGLDKINALPIYQSTGPDEDKPINDLIKFRIAVIDNDKPSQANYIHFRAFIDSFSDSYGTAWSGERYPGRGEEFYRYGGFTRGISLSFSAAAQSKQELIPMYKKLNYLASATMNDYSDSGYMRAPFIRLTVGGYLYEQFGFIKSLNYGWDMLAPFEIGINDKGTPDSSVKELPHVIKVTGFEFQPIYDFLPQKQQNGFSDSGKLTTYGPERYIALEAVGNNYDDTTP